MYADDVSIHVIAYNSNDHKLIQNDLNNFIRWANSWQLKNKFLKMSCDSFWT